jgi:hypothetical protein
LVVGFFAFLVIIGVGVYALATGHVDVAIGCLGGGFIATVAGVFVKGRNRKPSTTNEASEDNPTSKTQS